jgi:four helix bundle protein
MCPDVCDLLPRTKTGQTLKYQLSKSSTSSALVYGEAEAAESKPDFIHKMKVVLKEIRESGVNLRIIIEKPVIAMPNQGLDFTSCHDGGFRCNFLFYLKYNGEG